MIRIRLRSIDTKGRLADPEVRSRRQSTATSAPGDTSLAAVPSAAASTQIGDGTYAVASSAKQLLSISRD